MYLVKTPGLVQKLIPGITWKGDNRNKVIYLTFDDGPIPEVTPWVLDLLEQFEAKATFFCVGENIDRNPRIFQDIINKGHTVGNHTHSHLDGWTTNNELYLNNIFKCANRVKSNLFRPPYGRIKKNQFQFINKHYEIVLWHILSGDFDVDLSPEECIDNVTTNVEPGSIVVFHDSLKARYNLVNSLPTILEFLRNQGYSFKALKERPIQKQVYQQLHYSLC